MQVGVAAMAANDLESFKSFGLGQLPLTLSVQRLP